MKTEELDARGAMTLTLPEDQIHFLRKENNIIYTILPQQTIL